MNWVIRNIVLAIIYIIRQALKLPAPIILIGGAILSGLVMFLVQHIFKIRYVPAMIAGTMGFLILIVVLQKSKIDNLSWRYVVAVLVVLIHATLTLGAKHYSSYLYFKFTFTDMVRSTGHLNLTKYDADEYLLLSTGSAGIVGYIKYEIESGVSVSDSHNVIVGIRNQDYIYDQIGTLAIIIAIEAFFGIYSLQYQEKRRIQSRLT